MSYGSVLFACSMNAIRSPMAEALARHYFPRRFYVASAGIRKGEINNFTITVMEEIGLDISAHKPHSFEELEDSYFDLVITLAPEAHHWALEMTRHHSIEVEYWPIHDPSLTHGSRERQLEAYRGVRDTLAQKIKTRFI